MKKKILPLYILIGLSFIFNSCDCFMEDNEDILVDEPTLNTINAINVDIFTATINAELINDGGSPITERGICWSTQINPTINDSKKIDTCTTSSFSINLEDLLPLTTYYVKSYAINKKGIGYGNTITFTTIDILSSIATTAIDSIDLTTATSGGTVGNITDFTVTQKGVCWSTSPNPTINDNKTSDGPGIGSFPSKITGLTASTTYYVRAYATNSTEIIYGNEITFKTASILILQPGSEGIDAFINNRNPDNVGGAVSTIDVMSWTFLGVPFTSRAVIDFDFASIPEGATIKSATLSLFNNPSSPNNSGRHSDTIDYPTTGGDNAVYIKRIVSPWDESTVTWNTKPSTTDTNQGLIHATTDNHEDFPDIDITTVVQDIINNKSTSYGMMLQLKTESYYRGIIIASSDHPDPTKRPKLVVIYY